MSRHTMGVWTPACRDELILLCRKAVKSENWQCSLDLGGFTSSGSLTFSVPSSLSYNSQSVLTRQGTMKYPRCVDPLSVERIAVVCFYVQPRL